MRVSIDLTPFRWSVPGSARESIRRVVGEAEIAERAGFDAIWLSEDPEGWDAIAVLSAIAVRTERIGLTTGVLNPFYRHPSQMAAAAVTLDRLSGGRFRLGLGRGQTEWYGRSLGMAVDRPVTRLAETIDLLHQWWSDGYRASNDGAFAIADWRRALGPESEHISILLAAAGPQAIELAAREADGIIFNDLTALPVIQQTIDVARRARRTAKPFAFVARPVLALTDDPAPVYDRLKQRIAFINTLPGMARLIEAPGFDVPAIMAHVRRAMRTDEILDHGGNFVSLREAANFDAARALIPTQLVAQLAAIGSKQEIQRYLQKLLDFGVTEIVMRRYDLPAPPRWDEFVAIVREVAQLR